MATRVRAHRSLFNEDFVICFDFVKFARLNEQNKILLDFFLESFACSFAPC